MKFHFKAITKDGSKYEGEKDSNDKFTLYEELKAEGNTLISASEITESKFNINLPFFNSVPEQQKIIFAKNLGSMVSAGLSLSKALDIFEKQTTNKNFKKIIGSLETEIKKGKPLSEACSGYPKVFPKLFVSMVKAGEESGKLSESLKIVSDQMEGTYKLKKKIQGAMIYPAIICSLMVVIGVLMLIFVVPSITATFKSLNIKLPFLTQLLISSSDFLTHNILLTLVTAVLIVVFFYSFFHSKIGKRIYDSVVLKLPVVGLIIKETNSARITRTISSLLASGVSYTEAISITKDVIQNGKFKDILTTAITVVEKGGALSGVFMANTNLCPVFVAEMAVVGEETGKLPSMLMEVALFYEESVDQKTKDMSAIIEPVLMIIIGVVVGFFALAIIKPIYSLTDSIS